MFLMFFLIKGAWEFTYTYVHVHAHHEGARGEQVSDDKDEMHETGTTEPISSTPTKTVPNSPITSLKSGSVPSAI